MCIYTYILTLIKVKFLNHSTEENFMVGRRDRTSCHPYRYDLLPLTYTCVYIDVILARTPGQGNRDLHRLTRSKMFVYFLLGGIKTTLDSFPISLSFCFITIQRHSGPSVSSGWLMSSFQVGPTLQLQGSLSCMKRFST